MNLGRRLSMDWILAGTAPKVQGVAAWSQQTAGQETGDPPQPGGFQLEGREPACRGWQLVTRSPHLSAKSSLYRSEGNQGLGYWRSGMAFWSKYSNYSTCEKAISQVSRAFYHWKIYRLSRIQVGASEHVSQHSRCFSFVPSWPLSNSRRSSATSSPVYRSGRWGTYWSGEDHT